MLVCLTLELSTFFLEKNIHSPRWDVIILIFLHNETLCNKIHIFSNTHFL